MKAIRTLLTELNAQNKKRRNKGTSYIGWYKPAKWDWPGQNEKWYVAARWYHLGLGLVRTYWGWRILLVRWQVCIHDKEAEK